ncbi:GAF domain-containing protein [Clostridium sp. 19966]|uniref:GAF domain-containing protein n=1 Tax=Clostridium sp. 19966 TaxID=2768166 RepID=UPI0028E0876F|nr:GAF domain-containing protein [Clostridium sp. 19966]MDT8716344.1 GAF domain-containing protein [Clostridium sp. 19966]
MTDEEKYRYMNLLIEGQLKTEDDIIANLSNISAIIKSAIDRVNWAGFYLLKDDELVLGPFQGLAACCRIKLGEGVCGTAALNNMIQVVDDVHKFDGHIACDSASNSEIVIPITKNGKLFGVLDIDSPEFKRFGELEETYFTKAVEIMIENLNI